MVDSNHYDQVLSESNDHFTGDNLNDDEQTHLTPAKRISKTNTSSENVVPSLNINMSVQSLIPEQSGFKCDICNFCATTRIKLNNHKMKNHNDKV